MVRPTPATTTRKTPNFDFLFGTYSHSTEHIPYFQIAMSFADAAQYLRLVNEMPGAASMDWHIEELFQRDVDWSRVERRIVPYLIQEDQPQFFNSLTIALLPTRDDEICTFTGDDEWQAPGLEQEGHFDGNTREFGPIKCGYWGSWSAPTDDNARLGQLCWNTEEVCGVAIDGQHRLAAIKQVVGGGGRLARSCILPIILLVLHPELGYTGGGSRESLIRSLRRLFIDLNKHAVVPTRARQILLDDRDPASICVRAVVGSQLVRGTEELEEDPPSLPLTLVDWHSEQAKFDTGPYLATILGIDWAVAKLLNVKPVQDWMAHDDIGSLLRNFQRKLGIRLDNAEARLDECRRYEKPFSFKDEPVDELGMIGKAFQDTWAEALLDLLTGLKPYEKLIELRKTEDTLRPEFANWYALKQRADDASGAGTAERILSDFERHLSERPHDPIALQDFRDAIAVFERLKESRKLAFTVVFQRALVLALRMLVKVRDRMLEPEGEFEIDLDDALPEREGDDEEDDGAEDLKSERAQQLVEALNTVIANEPDFLLPSYEFRWFAEDRYDRFWLCSFVHPEGPIDFTQAASKRASDILLISALFRLVNQCHGVQEFEEAMELADSATTGLALKINQCFQRMCRNENSIAGRILSSRDEDMDEERAREEIAARASWLWSLVVED